MSDETKPCPACAETVKAAARICRFCKYDFEAGAPAAAPPRRGGFPVWIVVLIVVGACVPGVAIVAAIAIPGLLQAQRASNERGASATLKTFAMAQADFRSNDRDGNGVNDFWTGDVSSERIVLCESAIDAMSVTALHVDCIGIALGFRRPVRGVIPHGCHPYWLAGMR